MDHLRRHLPCIQGVDYGYPSANCARLTREAVLSLVIVEQIKLTSRDLHESTFRMMLSNYQDDSKLRFVRGAAAKYSGSVGSLDYVYSYKIQNS